MFATVFGMDCADVYGAQKRCLLAVDCSYYGCIGCRYRHHRKSMHTMAFFCSTPSLLTAARKQKMLNFFFFHVVLQPVLCNYRFSSFCILTESARNHHAIVHMNNVASIIWFFFLSRLFVGGAAKGETQTTHTLHSTRTATELQETLIFACTNDKFTPRWSSVVLWLYRLLWRRLECQPLHCRRHYRVPIVADRREQNKKQKKKNKIENKMVPIDYSFI